MNQEAQHFQDTIEALMAVSDDPSLEEVAGSLEAQFAYLQDDEIDTWLQHLMDLGYIDGDAGEAVYNADQKTPDKSRAAEVIAAGIRRYKADDPTFDPALTPDDTRLAGDVLDSNINPSVARPGAALLERLAHFTAFDGESGDIYDHLPPHGASNVYTRSLHYRLKILGLYQQAVAAPRAAYTDEALAILRAVFSGRKTDRELVTLLGDVRQLTHAFISDTDHTARLKPLIIRAEPAGDEAVEDYSRLLILGGRFVSNDQERKLYEQKHKPVTPEEKAAFDREKGYLENILAFETTPDSRIYHPYNETGRQILQLLLWMHGFYHGYIDLAWGPKKQKALQDALSFEGIDPREVMRYVGNSYWAVNMSAVVHQVFMTVDTAGTQMKDFETEILEDAEYTRDIAGDQGRDLAEGFEQREGFFKSLWSGVRSVVGRVVQYGRRIYRGARAMVLSAVKALRKGITWIKEEAGNLIGPVFNFVRTIFTRIREVIALMAQAMPRVLSFIFRRPIVTEPKADSDETGIAISQFDIDADVTNTTASDTSDTLLLRHGRICRTLARGAGLFLIIFATVARTIADMALVGVGWLRIGFRIGTLVRDLIAWNQQDQSGDWVWV